LMHKGAALVLKTVKAIEAGSVETKLQDETAQLKHAPKIFKETCEVNWSQPAEVIRNFVRGLSPYPAAWTKLNGKVYKLFKVKSVVDSRQSAVDAGQIDTDNKTFLKVKTLDGWISILEMQPEGKKRMTVDDFFRGNKIN